MIKSGSADPSKYKSLKILETVISHQSPNSTAPTQKYPEKHYLTASKFSLLRIIAFFDFLLIYNYYINTLSQ